MPLPESLRSQFSSTPDLDRTSSPPAVETGSTVDGLDVDYSAFQFDREADLVGEGGNAVVYRATVPDGSTVAVKRPFPKRTVETDVVDAMLDEAAKWDRVDDHPYVATVLDWGHDAVPWVAIEYLAGGSMAERIDDFGPTQRIWTAYAVADAAAYASGQRGLVHLDIKPQNVLFRETPDGTWDVPRVADWGLSRELIQHSGSISQATPDYAAPEQFEAHAPDAPVGPQTDVYQLGVVCYELLTGEHPSHLRGDVSPPSTVDSAVPAAFDEPISTALAHDQRDRFDHPILLREALGDAIETTRGESGDERGTVPQALTDGPDTAPDDDGGIAGESVDESPAVCESMSGDDWPSIDPGVDDAPNADVGDGPNAGGDDLFGGDDGAASNAGGDDVSITTEAVFDLGSVVRAGPILEDGTVYVGCQDGSLYAVDAATGRERWRYRADGIVTDFAVEGGTVYVPGDQRLVALDADTGSRRWTYRNDSMSGVPTAMAVREDVVYLGTRTVYAVDPATRETEWTEAAGSRVHALATDMFHVYVGTDDGKVRSLGKHHGNRDWSRYVGDGVQRLVYDSGLLYLRDRSGEIAAYGRDAGDLEWSVRGSSQSGVGPVTATGDVAACLGGEFVSTSKKDGDVRWRYEPDATFGFSPRALAVGGHAFVGEHDGTVHALDSWGARHVWETTLEDGGEGIRGFALPRDRLIVAAGDRLVGVRTDAEHGY